MSDEMEEKALAFTSAWGPEVGTADREGFCNELADLLSMAGREIILNALRRAE